MATRDTISYVMFKFANLQICKETLMIINKATSRANIMRTCVWDMVWQKLHY